VTPSHTSRPARSVWCTAARPQDAPATQSMHCHTRCMHAAMRKAVCTRAHARVTRRTRTRARPAAAASGALAATRRAACNPAAWLHGCTHARVKADKASGSVQQRDKRRRQNLARTQVRTLDSRRAALAAGAMAVTRILLRNCVYCAALRGHAGLAQQRTMPSRSSSYARTAVD
jgi:hypothetical protein